MSSSRLIHRSTTRVNDHGQTYMKTDGTTPLVSTGRRRTLFSLISAVVVSACSRVVPGSKSPPMPTVSVADPGFLRISRVLTGHDDLDERAAARYSAALATLATASGEWQRLLPLIEGSRSPEAALAAADGAGMKPVALSIVAAWYTGTVGNGVPAITVSYRDALMQRATADALAPPTYALGGPAWWVAAPPDVGMSRPTRPAPHPPTVGNPEPKTP